MFGFPLVQRIVLKELFMLFCLIVLVMVFLLLLLQGNRMESYFVGIEVTVADIFILLLLLMPYLLTFIFPIATMLSVFLTLFRMFSDKELVALRASGISIIQLLPAVVFFGIITAGISMWLFLYAVPQGTENFQKALSSLASQRANINVIPKVFYTRIPNVALFVEKVNEDKSMDSIFLEQKNSDGSIITIIANKGSVVINPQEYTLQLVLDNGKLYRVEDESYIASSFIRYTVSLPLVDIVKQITFSALKFDNMSLNQLLNAIEEYKVKKRTSEVNTTLRAMRVEVQKRFIFPIACIILALFTVPLATSPEASRNIVLMFLLLAFIVYYGITLFCINLAESGAIPPTGVWLSNILYAVITIRSLYFTSKERGVLFIFRVKEYIYSLLIRCMKKKRA